MVLLCSSSQLKVWKGKDSDCRKSHPILINTLFILFVVKSLTAVKPARQTVPKSYNGNSMGEIIKNGTLKRYDLFMLIFVIL